MKKKIIAIGLLLTIMVTGCEFPEKHITKKIIVHHTGTATPQETMAPNKETTQEPTTKPETTNTPKPTKKPKKNKVTGLQSKKERPGIYTISWLRYRGASGYQTEISERKSFSKYTSRHNLKEVSIDIYTRSGRPTYIRVRALVHGKYTPWSDIYNVRTGKRVKR